MSCNFETIEVIAVTVNCIGLLANLISLACILTNKELERSLRGILVSFSFANVLGACMFAYDLVAHACAVEVTDPYDFVLIITTVLSLSHLLLLNLHYYIIITSGNRVKKGRDFSGLVLTAWITSAALGSMNVTMRGKGGKVFLLTFFYF